MKSEIHICLITDEKYTIPTVVALSSARENKNEQSVYVLHCLVDNVCELSARQILALNRSDFHVRIYKTDSLKYRDVKMHEHFSFATMLKIEIAEILTEVDKVLFIDSDVLVRKDLSELYDYDISDYYIAAVKDMTGVIEGKFDKIVGVHSYFNSGVMLMNLKCMRENKVSQKIIDCKRNAPANWKMVDQDPYNKVCAGRVLFLPVKYNCCLPLYMRETSFFPIDVINSFFGVAYRNHKELEEDAHVVHFAGVKPWNYKDSLYTNMWYFYYNLSPYRDFCFNDASCDELNQIKTKTVLLFGFMPILKISYTPYKRVYRLFNIIDLLKINYDTDKLRVRLFGGFPLLYTKVKRFVKIWNNDRRYSITHKSINEK